MAGRRELRTRISRVGLDGREYRVIRPDRPAGRLVLHDESHWYSGFADRDALAQLTTLWSLAAASPRSIVQVPTRQNDSPYEGRSVDLVLSHASLQLRPARWKALRARLADGAPHKVDVPDPRHEAETDYDRLRYREYRDLLKFDSAADTLFVTGGRESFLRAAGQLRTLWADSGSHRGDGGGAGHICAEINVGTWPPGRTRHGTPGMLHIQYEPDDWSVPASH
jgi:hypothetical protein